MKPYRTFLFVVAIIALLGIVCFFFPQGGITIMGKTLRMPTISSILAGGSADPNVDIDEIDKRRRSKTEEILYAQMTQKLQFYKDYIADSTRGIALPDDDMNFFDDFFSKAEAAAHNGKVVRVLHYGDSQIEMDRMSDVLRAFMQAKFGGLGAGLIPFSQTIPCTSVSQFASGDFTLYASYGDSTVARNYGHYGPMAKCSRINSSATITINATKRDERDEHLKSFSKITVLFDNLGGNLTATLSYKGKSEPQTCTGHGVHSLTWQLDSAVASVRLAISGYSDIYGIMVDGKYGVSVDNISMRGASGHQIQMIDSALLAQSFAQMNVGLILFQYGGNSVPYLQSEASRQRYADEMARQLRILHNTCPGAKIVFIGPADMCRYTDSLGLSTYRHLAEVVRTLRATALENHCAFWSMYHVMGGNGSMSSWVKSGLAGGDYLHFTEKGARKMAGYLVEAFETMYDFYTLKKKIPPETLEQSWKENSKQQ